MNDFNEKPITAEVRALVHEIVDRAMSYNSTSTKQDFTGDKPTFFVSFAGHTACLYAEIHANGWEPEDKSEDFIVRLSEREYNGTCEDIQTELVSVLKRMEKVYTTWYEKENPND